MSNPHHDMDPVYYGPNAAVIADLYSKFLANPGSVDEGWKSFFGDLEDDARNLLTGMNGGAAPAAAPVPAGVTNGVMPAGGITPADVRAATLDSIRALMLIRAYRVRGHLEAKLDPLGLKPVEPHPELDPKTYGFTDSDLDRPIFIDRVLGLETATLRQIVEAVRKTYCGTIGVEFMHIQDPAQKAWIQERVESIHNQTEFTYNGKKAILERLIAAEGFEQFLDKKYTGTKRFGLDGGESMIPALEQILKRGSQLGLEEVVVGMPHRGRLNVLANFMGKPFTAIFSEFQGGAAHPEDIGGSGDVKYHLGTSSDREFDGTTIHLSLTANPSHLEAVNPVVVGKVRAKQNQREVRDNKKVMALLMHGDAAFAGQGLVPETLDLSELKGYRIGGTIHFVVNNQIGFTTNPVNSRSGPYCSDVAKIIQAPILHVNGDDPEAVVHVARIATEFRQTFEKDVVIDMFCYRRFGHNEGDEPAFTQPLMYRKIKKHPTTRQIYADYLISQGTFTRQETDSMVQEWVQRLEQDFESSKSFKPNKADWLEGAWSGLDIARGYDARRGKTAVPIKTLKEIGSALTRVPDDFNLNRKIARQLKTKEDMFKSGEGIDWATAEALAFGSLLIEGSPIRLSGQDCNRGTFSHRHAALIDQEDETRYKPLKYIRENQAQIEIFDSPLSELAVLGFEYGYSLAEPRALVLWEAQFGDFVNGAQIIIDQFIASGESKWLRMSGLVMLLPHGYEGQGPEHSSGRVERFLQLCAEDNIQVVNCTTPANYFHVLRRQLKRDFRKPLIIMTPKSLLRHKRAVSKLSDMGPGSGFHRVMYCDDVPSKPKDAKQVVICTGKVYYDLVEEREKRGVKDVHFLRMEQLYPFPADALAMELEPYRNCDVVWCQEEPRNMGAWNHVSEFIEEVAAEMGFKNPRPRYAGRSSAASPATGQNKRHLAEQAALINEALTLGLKPLGRIASRKAAAEGKGGKKAAKK
ncbi:2-oxoglutarate dehydrogenase E1 component [Pelagibius sp. Alg239-R121]|uniref:2-oxoglutarate dehydrogenase E1 component n=1 Tax=Pelagibius sp. Alg239-R121 TaxID=2993448 RepID=UPI0024A69145|nr:2-oxoglutarate dehydrogenase E1 component [Pelagibius sp. Alg239-R121]